MKVNILGTDYEIIIGNEEDYPRLRLTLIHISEPTRP